MATINKLKIIALPDVLRRTFGLGKEGEVEVEIENQVIILKPLASPKREKSAKNTASVLQEIMRSLPEPEEHEEMTDYSSNIDKYLYKTT